MNPQLRSDIEFILDVITALGILLAVIGLFINMRTNYLTVMQKCIEEYRRIVREIQKSGGQDWKVLKLDMLGLFNEQLYYCKRWYLPRTIKEEWLKTMHRHLKENKNNGDITFTEKDWEDFNEIKEYFK